MLEFTLFKNGRGRTRFRISLALPSARHDDQHEHGHLSVLNPRAHNLRPQPLTIHNPKTG